MRRAHPWMHCQRIEINLGVLAGLSLVAIVVLSSRRKGEVSAVGALLRVMSNKGAWSAQYPCELARSRHDRQLKAVRASGMDRGAFREQQEKEPRLAGSASQMISPWRQHF